MSPKLSLRKQVLAAVEACEAKGAQAISVLELEKGSGAFTDYFVVLSGSNPRQIQTIADSVLEKLEAAGLRAGHTEGYQQAEWVLLDYVDFVVHIFSEKARRFYDLERLWRSARRLSPAELAKPLRAASRSKPKRSSAAVSKPKPRRRAGKRARR